MSSWSIGLSFDDSGKHEWRANVGNNSYNLSTIVEDNSRRTVEQIVRPLRDIEMDFSMLSQNGTNTEVSSDRVYTHTPSQANKTFNHETVAKKEFMCQDRHAKPKSVQTSSDIDVVDKFVSKAAVKSADALAFSSASALAVKNGRPDLAVGAGIAAASVVETANQHYDNPVEKISSKARETLALKTVREESTYEDGSKKVVHSSLGYRSEMKMDDRGKKIEESTTEDGLQVYRKFNEDGSYTQTKWHLKYGGEKVQKFDCQGNEIKEQQGSRCVIA